MAGESEDVRQPLLSRSPSSTHSNHGSISKGSDTLTDRSLEHDVLPAHSGPLKRTIGWGSAYVLIISRVIGSGIFATPGAIFKGTGSVGMTLVLWVVGAIIASFGLAVSLEYGCMLPRSGGHKVDISMVLHVFGQYVLFAFRIEPTPLLQKSLAVVLLTAITIIHGCFLRTGILIQNVLGWIKVGLIVFMILTGLFVVLVRPETNANSIGGVPHMASWDSLWEGTIWNWGILSTALFKVFYSYAGLENVNNVLNEVKNPVKTLKSAATAALATACILYLLVNCAYFLVVPLDEIRSSGELIAALFFERTFGPTVGRTILPLAVAVSAVGNVMVVIFALARLNQEVARQGFLPFSRILSSSKPFGAPLGGLIVHYVPSFLVIVLPPSKEVYSFILEVEGYPAQLFSLALSIGLLRLRYTRPDLERPFKAWIPGVLLRITMSLLLLAAPFVPPPASKRHGLWYATYAVVGSSVPLFGIIYWYIWTVALPRWRGYYLEEAVEILDDGTSITKLVHIHEN
ncbi:methionine permease [Venturia nashicola]|nr:methionine permease [Venturia nashicola]